MLRKGYNSIMRYTFVCLALLATFCTYAQTSTPYTPPKTRILFVLDASNSMYSRMGTDDRMTVAKKLLSRMVDSLSQIDELEIALRVYGHQIGKDDYDCKDTKLEVPFSPVNHNNIKEKLKQIKPRGTTLIAYSLQQAAYDFPSASSTRNIIILITDGIEECNGDPCAVSAALQQQGVVLKPFIIGVGLNKEFQQQFECVGKYFEATTEDAFEEVLDIVVAQALSNTTVQVNLNNTAGLPKETDVNVSFVDAHSGEFIRNIVHTINRYGHPDTIYLDPAHDYDVIVHTIPPLRKENISLKGGTHTTIEFDAPQGNLELVVDGVSGYGRLNAIVYIAGTKEIVNVQTFNTKEPYITGTYDLEILTLPRRFQPNVPIKQSKKTKLQIPQPGSVNLITKNQFWGDIYLVKGIEREWVCNVDLEGTSKRIVMQPGTYAVVTRGKNDQNVINSHEEIFQIQSGKVTNIKL